MFVVLWPLRYAEMMFSSFSVVVLNMHMLRIFLISDRSEDYRVISFRFV